MISISELSVGPSGYFGGQMAKKGMLVPLVTMETQGFRQSDFFWAKAGELALLKTGCDDYEHVDGGCGCKRSFTGFSSRKCSTTAVIVEVDDTSFLRKLTQEEINWVVRAGRRFNEGDVIERRDNKIQKRVNANDV